MDSDPHHKPSGGHGHGHKQHSSSELLSSAKLVAEAAQYTLRHESDKVDRAKVSAAAGDLLEAASQYGKLEEKGLDKYVDKAEEYLRRQSHSGGGHSEHSTKPESHGDGHSGGGYGDSLKMAQGFMKSDSAADSHSSKPESHGDGHSGGGGYGDYLKMAQGFMKSDSAADSHSSKPESHGDGNSGGGGYGGYLKMAEGFLKKH